MALGFKLVKLGKEEGDCPWAACTLKCDQVRGVGRPVNAKKALICQAQSEPVNPIDSEKVFMVLESIEVAINEIPENESMRFEENSVFSSLSLE